MGGKLWSKDEEEVFWLQLIPHSPKRIGDDRVKNKEHSWYWFADQMIQIMGHNARREYTPLCVFEHYFQNACLGRFSSKVGRLPLKYWRHGTLPTQSIYANKQRVNTDRASTQATEG
ncbi:hypothetical protein BT67DRAFT_371107 [Trichocladium antarcticum]|uniref:Uncharacterized protein n=1 Tax=Trichocladium antarcticum TaxID=1450529 RepID=A0AAN6ZGZ4_9PEZI|nr:hypothetical protein BT67DRAFT_371107 [Trichocladium antarcticum]